MRPLLTALLVLVASAASADREDAAGVLRVALPLYAAAYAWREDDDAGMRQWLTSTAVTVGTTYALKELVEKDRPDGSGDDAFPSGHAAAAFSGAAFLHRRYGMRAAWPAYALAGWTAWSRVATDDHDALDVSAAAAVALASAWWTVTPRDASVSVFPYVDGDSAGIRVSARF